MDKMEYFVKVWLGTVFFCPFCFILGIIMQNMSAFVMSAFLFFVFFIGAIASVAWCKSASTNVKQESFTKNDKVSDCEVVSNKVKKPLSYQEYADNTKKALTYTAIVFVIVAGLIIGIDPFSTSSHYSRSSNNDTCHVCGRTFTDSGNTKSIARTNMCKNCYSNYTWAVGE